MKMKVVCYQLEVGKIFADVSTECSSHHQAKLKKCGQTTVYSHALLRIHVNGDQKLIWIALPPP